MWICIISFALGGALGWLLFGSELPWDGTGRMHHRFPPSEVHLELVAGFSVIYICVLHERDEAESVHNSKGGDNEKLSVWIEEVLNRVFRVICKQIYC